MDSGQPNPQSTPPATPAGPAPSYDPAKVQAFRNQMAQEQNLGLGIVGGLAAALVGAAVWAGVTVTTNYQIGWMAVGVGFLVGYAVRMLGKGVTPVFGVTGAACALVGCLLGNLFTGCWFVAAEEGVSLGTVFAAMGPELAGLILKATFSPMDLLFYGIAVYEGYKFSFRQVTAAELQTLV